MTLSHGTKLGAYEVIAAIGAGAGAANLRWLPDGRRAVALLQGRVILLDVGTGQWKEILSVSPDTVTQLAPSPDAKWLYFSRNTLSGDVWLVKFTTPTASVETAQ